MVEEITSREYRDPLLAVAQLVRENSRLNAKLTPREMIYAELADMRPEEVQELFRQLEESDLYEDIHILQDPERDRVYLYATPFICEAYARTSLLVERKDPLKLIAETVREESRLYPRPTCSLLFTLPPYELNLVELPGLLEQMAQNDEMQDIRSFKASTGTLYLYSELYMTKEHAVGLAEWAEVEQFESQ